MGRVLLEVASALRAVLDLIAIQAHCKDKPANFSGTTLIIALILEISVEISMDFMIDRSMLSFHNGGRGCMCSNHNSALPAHTQKGSAEQKFGHKNALFYTICATQDVYGCLKFLWLLDEAIA